MSNDNFNYKEFLKEYKPTIKNYKDAFLIPHQLYIFFLALIVVLIDIIVFRLLSGGINE